MIYYYYDNAKIVIVEIEANNLLEQTGLNPKNFLVDKNNVFRDTETRRGTLDSSSRSDSG